jgi:hypothetical protein
LAVPAVLVSKLRVAYSPYILVAMTGDGIPVTNGGGDVVYGFQTPTKARFIGSQVVVSTTPKSMTVSLPCYGSDEDRTSVRTGKRLLLCFSNISTDEYVVDTAKAFDDFMGGEAGYLRTGQVKPLDQPVCAKCTFLGVGLALGGLQVHLFWQGGLIHRYYHRYPLVKPPFSHTGYASRAGYLLSSPPTSESFTGVSMAFPLVSFALVQALSI